MESIVKSCGKCQTTFRCSMASDHDCWCEALPAYRFEKSTRDCVCPECRLEEARSLVNQAISTFKTNKTNHPVAKIRSDTSYLMEGVDYYVEDDLYVFTEWYHLKRGYCCGSGCKLCPYDHINVPGLKSKS